MSPTTTDGRALLTPAELAVMLGIASTGTYIPEMRIGRALARWDFIAPDPINGGRWAQTPTGARAAREALDLGVGPDRRILHGFGLGGPDYVPPTFAGLRVSDLPDPDPEPVTRRYVDEHVHRVHRADAAGKDPGPQDASPQAAPLAAAPEPLAFQCDVHWDEVVVVRARQVSGDLWDVPTAPRCGHPDHGLDPFAWPEMRRVRVRDGRRQS